MRRHVVILLVEANAFLMAAYVAQHSLCQGGVSGGRQLATHGGNQAGGHVTSSTRCLPYNISNWLS